MSENPSPYNRRWYDQINNMTLAMQLSQYMPEEVQLVIARNLNEAIDEFRRHKRNDKYAVSLGQQRVIGLYKAGKHMRWYDPQPSLHRAFTYMSTVPDPFLAEFASRILLVGHYVDNRQPYTHYGDGSLIVDAVESIMQENTVSIEEGKDGIKLVSGLGHTIDPLKPQRHILPAGQRRQPPRHR